MIIIRKVIESDIVSLAVRLRKEDHDELIEAGYETTQKAIEQSVQRSLVSLCVEHGNDSSSLKPIAIFGLVPDSLLGRSACAWFLGTDDMKNIRKSFVKQSRMFVKEWMKQYPILWNVFPKSYVKTCRWLTFLGAKFYDMKQPEGFVLFTLETK